MELKNENNPLDYLGFYHNKILDDLVGELDDANTSFKNPFYFFKWFQGYMIERSINYLSPDLLQGDNRCMRLRVENSATGATVLSNSLYLDEGFEGLIDLSALSNNEKDYFNDLNEYIVNSDIETTNQLEEVISTLKQKEDNVADNLEDAGRYAMDMAYFMLSVAKYSCSYWHNNFSDTQSKWHGLKIKFDDFDDWDFEVPAAQHWSDYAADDAAGAIGAVITSGGLAGPWGVLGGAAFSTGWSIFKDNI